MRVWKERAFRARLPVTSEPRQNSERYGRYKLDSDAAKEFVFTIENIVKDVSSSQSDDTQRSIRQSLSQMVWRICS